MDNVKAIFLDMDGTILHENNQASTYTKDVINQLREKGYKVFLATGRSHSEIHQLVPQDFAVNGIISSNGTIGEVDGEIIFKHGLSLAQVQQITNLAKRQQIYYEVFPFEGNRVSLKEDETWMRDMIRSQDPINGVSHSEWSSRQDALAGKIDWVTKFPEGEYSFNIFNSVVLPAPFNPYNIHLSPLAICQEIFFKIVFPCFIRPI